MSQLLEHAPDHPLVYGMIFNDEDAEALGAMCRRLRPSLLYRSRWYCQFLVQCAARNRLDEPSAFLSEGGIHGGYRRERNNYLEALIIVRFANRLQNRRRVHVPDQRIKRQGVEGGGGVPGIVGA